MPELVGAALGLEDTLRSSGVCGSDEFSGAEYDPIYSVVSVQLGNFLRIVGKMKCTVEVEASWYIFERVPEWAFEG